MKLLFQKYMFKLYGFKRHKKEEIIR